MTYPQNKIPLAYPLTISAYPTYYILLRLHTYYLLPSLPNKLITYPTFNKSII